MATHPTLHRLLDRRHRVVHLHHPDRAHAVHQRLGAAVGASVEDSQLSEILFDQNSQRRRLLSLLRQDYEVYVMFTLRRKLSIERE